MATRSRLLSGTLFAVASALTLGACADQPAETRKAATPQAAATGETLDGELIILAAPLVEDPYYQDVAGEIFAFHVSFATAVKSPDRTLILADEANHDAYADALPDAYVMTFPQGDIWTRDFAPVDPLSPVMMRYPRQGTDGGRFTQKYADAVQGGLYDLTRESRLAMTRSDLNLNGGDFVYDGDGRLVVSRTFLKDNGLSPAQGRTALRRATNATDIAFIDAKAQTGLEQADSVLSFIAPNTLVIHRFPDDFDYAETLKTTLRNALPGVTIHEIETRYDPKAALDTRFRSTCGLYTDMVVTPTRIFVPVFGREADKTVLSQLHSWTDKQLVPVDTSRICTLGGGLRTMSWQLRGEAANAVLDFISGGETTP